MTADRGDAPHAPDGLKAAIRAVLEPPLRRLTERIVGPKFRVRRER